MIAPGITNHNETLVSDIAEIELSVEELEEVIAPGIITTTKRSSATRRDRIEYRRVGGSDRSGIAWNHNEMLVNDIAEID